MSGRSERGWFARRAARRRKAPAPMVSATVNWLPVGVPLTAARAEPRGSRLAVDRSRYTNRSARPLRSTVLSAYAPPKAISVMRGVVAGDSFVLDVFSQVSQSVASTGHRAGEARMALPGKEPIIADVVSLVFECMDCGKTRRRRPQEMKLFGVNGSTRLSDLSTRLYCSACRNEGLPGQHISVQAAFANELSRERANAYRLNSHEAHGWAPPATCA